jgi:hypothetical protein
MTVEQVVTYRADLVAALSEDLREGRDPQQRLQAEFESAMPFIPEPEIANQVRFVVKLRALLRLVRGRQLQAV